MKRVWKKALGLLLALALLATSPAALAAEDLAEIPPAPAADPVEGPPVEETPAEETPVEEAPAEETPAEEPPVEEPPVEDPPAVEPPVEEPPVEEAPAEEPPVGEPAEEPMVDVLVPATGELRVNPYRMRMELEDGGESREQVFHAPQYLVNRGPTPVLVQAAARGRTAPDSPLVFVDEPPAVDALDKEVFLYVEFQDAGDGGETGDWREEYGGWDGQLLVSSDPAEPESVLVLAAGDEAPSRGAFRLFGAMTDFPEEMWTGDDAIDVQIDFTFIPLDEDGLPLEPLAEAPAPEAVPEAPPEAGPETPPEAEPETPPEAEPETLPEAEPETPPETEPETPPETEPGTPPEEAPEAPPASEPGTPPETEPGTEQTDPEPGPEPEPAPEPDPAPEAEPEPGPEVPPETAPDQSA